MIKIIETSLKNVPGPQGDRPVPTDRPDAVNAQDVHIDVRSLEKELRASVRGDVFFDDAYRAMYSTDAANYRQVPICVVLPRDAGDAQQAMSIAHRYGAPVTPRGGGTSLTGASCNAAVIFDYSKYMNRILEIDFEKHRARVEPGVVLDDLRDAAEKGGLTFGPAPSTHNRCNIGGMFGNNACGIPAQFAGRMEENVEDVEVLLHDGTRMRVGSTSAQEYETIARGGGRKSEIYARLRDIHEKYHDLVAQKFPDIPRRVSGYNLEQLSPRSGFNVARALVGTEGTCVHVLELTLMLVPNPKTTALALIGFEDIATAGDHVAFCNQYMPHAMEGMDETLFQHMHEKGKNPHQKEELFPDGRAWLVIQFGGDSDEEVCRKAQTLIDDIKKHSGKVRGTRTTSEPHTMHEIFQTREAGLGVNAKLPNQA